MCISCIIILTQNLLAFCFPVRIQFKNIFHYIGCTVYFMPPCSARYFDEVAFIFSACQILTLRAQILSFRAVLRRDEKTNSKEEGLYDMYQPPLLDGGVEGERGEGEWEEEREGEEKENY